jgi:diguanylate cyclase (GGDEF)-like protein
MQYNSNVVHDKLAPAVQQVKHDSPHLTDLFNIGELQRIQDAFAVVTGVASVITDVSGNPITKPSNFCELCNIIRSTKQGAANCKKSDSVIGKANPADSKSEPCLSGGLWDGGASIYVDKIHIANWLVGQVLSEEQTEGQIIAYAKEIGADLHEVRRAFTEVTRMSLKKFTDICHFLELFAHQLSKLATENVQKEREIQRRLRAEKLQAALYHISETASAARNLDELYQSVHVIINDLIPAKNFYIAIEDEENDMLHFPYRVDEFDGNPGSRKLVNGLVEYLLKTGQPLLITPQLRLELEKSGAAQTIGTRAIDWLGVPLKTANNKVFGIMAVYSYIERVTYTQEHQDMLSFVSNQVAMAIERKQAEEKLRYIGTHDTLTDLYNRAFFEETLACCGTDAHKPLTILMCDIDGLKLVNDTFGHAAGDQLLLSTAQLLRLAIREGDIAARIGGDEFAIIMPRAGERAAKFIVKRIRTAVERHNQENSGIPISISLGYANGKDTTTSPQSLLKEADNQMYREKLHHSQSVRSAIVQTVMKMLEERDFATEEHADRLQYLIDKIARSMQFAESRIADLKLLARFHDIGKVGIPDHILLKPGPLTNDEKKIMHRHCEVGYRIAQSAVDLMPTAEWILKHHEWYDGSGYPLGLAGEAIPIECRILAVADAYDAMTSNRPYRKAVSHEAAISELKRCAGTQFDPRIVETFIAVL